MKARFIEFVQAITVITVIFSMFFIIYYVTVNVFFDWDPLSVETFLD